MHPGSSSGGRGSNSSGGRRPGQAGGTSGSPQARNSSRSSPLAPSPGHYPLDSPMRNGSTPQRALLSTGVSANPEEEFTYLVDHYRTWILTVAHEARQYHALGFRVYNSTDMIEVTQWVNPTTAPDTTDAFRSQNEETDRVLEALEDEADAGRYREDKGRHSSRGTPTRNDHRSPPGSEGSGRQGPGSGGAGAGSGISAS